MANGGFDEALRKIDEGLAAETSLKEGLEWAVEHGWMSDEDKERLLRQDHLSHVTALPEQPEGQPIVIDHDSLASPVGYLAVNNSILG